MVLLSEFSEPSNKREVSSAYCDNRNSSASTLIPLILSLYLITIDKISAHKIHR